MIPVEQCEHVEMHFGSGDFYIFCRGCGGSWARIDSGQQAEYGVDKDGNPVGVAPQAANRGVGMYLSGKVLRRAD